MNDKVEAMKNVWLSPFLTQGEKIFGFFKARTEPQGFWERLNVATFTSGIQFFYVGLTDKGFHLTMVDKGKSTLTSDAVGVHRFIAFEEIESIQFKKSILFPKMYLTLKKGETIFLKPIFHGVASVPVMDETAGQFLKGRFAL